MKILITGGCGFIGSNLAILLKSRYPHSHVIVMDNLKRRGSELNITRLHEHGVSFVHGDIREPDDFPVVDHLDFVIDAAAEPSVAAGTSAGLGYVLNTNYTGSVNTFNVALKHKARVIFLSTSRVYPIAHLQNLQYVESGTRFELASQQSISGVSAAGISENFPLDKARSIYGTTKLSCELLLEEYKAFLGLDYVINRCGVVAGPYQMGKVDQGVIALWVARHVWQQGVKYFGYNGTGLQVRDVLHVQDLFNLVCLQIENFEKVNGNLYNVGGGLGVSTSLKELTAICAEVTGNSVSATPVTQGSVADIPWYITDNAKIFAELGWQPALGIKDIVADIFNWIKSNEAQLKPILL